MKIYDTFMFHDEVDLLQLRMQEHDPFVDHFVIVQADRTFTGKEKTNISLRTNPHFSKYFKKIIEINTSLDSNPTSPWDNEKRQRDAQLSRINLLGDDLVYVSDVDEIISRNWWPYLIERLKTENIIGVWLEMFYYSLNLRAQNVVWTLPKLCRGNSIIGSKITASQLRVLPSHIVSASPCGWHFSYLMSPAEISKKISAFSHQEFNVPEINDPKAIADSILARRDLFGRDIQYHAVPVNKTWPIGVLEDPKWKENISPVSAKDKVNQKLSLLKNRILQNPVRSKFVTTLNRIRFSSVHPTDYNEFDKRTFNDLMLCKPPNNDSPEWRRLIEFLSSLPPQLEGWFSAKQCAELFMQIVKSVPMGGKIVEVGSWKGRSSVFASRAAAVVGASLFCVDTWEGNIGEGENHPTVVAAKTQDVFGEFKKNIALYGCDNVVICKGESQQVAANWNEGPIDLLFIDGGHDYESVTCDLSSWAPHLNPGAVVCGDDWNREDLPDLKGSVRKAFTDFFKTQIPNLGITERFWAHQI